MLDIDIEELMIDVQEDITIFIPVVPNNGNDDYGDSTTTFIAVQSNAYFAVNKRLRESQPRSGTEIDVESFYIYIPQSIYEQHKAMWCRGAYIVRTLEKKRYDVVDVDLSTRGLSRSILIGEYNGKSDNYDTI